jgi:hypothetical protein
MKHPSEATLALHAGGDLGWVARWRVERHLAQCDECRQELTAFEGVRAIAADLAEIPEVPWNRLAAEMRANIRLGLAAGECVKSADAPLRDTPLFTGARAVVAMGSIAALLVTGLVLQRPPKLVPTVYAEDRATVQATADGIEMGDGTHAFRLKSGGAKRVLFMAGAEGSMRARSVDPDTGYVTIRQVNAE